MESAKVFRLRLGPLTYELVRSEPLELGNCRLVLVARVFYVARRSATVAWTRVSGWGMHAASLAPVALIEERGSKRRLMPIIDVNKLIRWALVGACLATILAVSSVNRSLERSRLGQG